AHRDRTRRCRSAGGRRRGLPSATAAAPRAPACATGAAARRAPCRRGACRAAAPRSRCARAARRRCGRGRKARWRPFWYSSISVDFRIPPMEIPADGLVAFAKRECETCEMVRPLLAELPGVRLYVQDEPAWFQGDDVRDDTALEASWRHDVETVPTLIRMIDGKEAGRAEGWVRDEWRAVSGLAGIGADLPAFRPGCGSKSREPGVHEQLIARFGDTGFVSRR